MPTSALDPWRNPLTPPPTPRPAPLLDLRAHAHAHAPAAKPARRAPSTRKRLPDAAKEALLSIPAPVLLVDGGGRIALCNEEAARLLGAERAALEGAALESVLAPIDVLRSAVEEGARGEVRFDRPGGKTSCIGYRFAAYPPAGGKLSALVLDDAPERRRKVGSRSEPMPFDVAEVLQMAAMARRTLAVDVEAAPGLFGRIVVVDGAPWHASDSEGEGVAAFRRMAFKPGARACCKAVAGDPPPRNLEGGLDELLLEAARLHDEEARGAP